MVREPWVGAVHDTSYWRDVNITLFVKARFHLTVYGLYQESTRESNLVSTYTGIQDTEPLTV